MILKLLPDNVTYNRITLKSEGNYIESNGFYLHGKLESKIGYDLVSIINAKECPEIIKYIPEIDILDIYSDWASGIANNQIKLVPKFYYNGILDCNVIGIDESCIGYFWTVDEKELLVSAFYSKETFKGLYWCQRGLICLKSDIEACKDAEEKYNTKKVYI